MRRYIALAIVLVTAYLVVSAVPDDALAVRATGLALGFALIAATVVGRLFERIRLPRVTGYLLFGVIMGPYVADIISRPMAHELEIFNGLAIALIAFVSGLEMNMQRLRPHLSAIGRMGGVTIAVSYIGLIALLWFAWPWLPILPEVVAAERLSVIVLFAALVISFSPTMTLAIIAESRSRGPFSQLVLSVTILGDLVLILLFALSMQWVRWTLGGVTASDIGLLAHLSWEIFGSLAFGAILGAAFAFYLRHVGREATVVLIALCVLLSEVGRRLYFEPLLAALAAGLVVENIAHVTGDALRKAVERGALPVLVVFFVGAGASLNLDALALVGLTAVAIACYRAVLFWLGSSFAARSAEVEAAHGRSAWMGFVSQAGVTVGLAMLVAAEFPTWGSRMQVIIVAMVALHGLIGPVLFRNALARAGEIGGADRLEEHNDPAAVAALPHTSDPVAQPRPRLEGLRSILRSSLRRPGSRPPDSG
jgi:Kef-type K+ transport system membrane component KefB